MTEAHRLFFYFLRKGLWGSSAEPDTSISDSVWEELFLLSCRQAVSGIVADGIAATSLRPPSGLWHKWVFQLLHIEMVNDEMSRCGDSLLRLLSAGGIKASVFKGTSVARWYPKPSHRSYGDIDIIIHSGRERLTEVLRRYGIPFFYAGNDVIIEQPDNIIGHQNGSGKRNSSYGQYRIELHPTYETLYNPIMNARLQRIVTGSSAWWNKNIGRCGKPHDTPEFYLACIILHLRRHALSYGIGLKQVCDVAVMLRNAGIDAERLKMILKHLGAWRFGRALLRFVEAYLYGEGYVGPQRRAGKDMKMLFGIFMRDGYELKTERENIGNNTRLSSLRVVKNGCFWVRRSLRMFSLMQDEAFFFVLDKALDRIKALSRIITGG